MSRHKKRGSSSESDDERKQKKLKQHHGEEESHTSSHSHGHRSHTGGHDRRGEHRVARRGHDDTGRSRDRGDHGRHRSSQHKDRDVHLDPHRRIKQEPSDEFAEQQQERRQHDERRRESRQQRERESGDGAFGGSAASEDNSAKEKEKPNFKLSGKLTEDTNTFRGVVIKYNEPSEARKPKRRWRLYPFKGETALPMLPVHRQSAYLLGRDRRVADIPVDHPSCSKQHAVLQYRLTEYQRPDGSMGRKVRPYIIDLGSANGTYVNNQRIDSQRYVELFERDLIKFGFSSREYVLLHENVDTSEVAEEADSE
ncbi:hypothetical protein BaRGS_00013945 [Batillaria attramentaria]|uniref:FHA domain-containing protein n=1 Tax=Batillaria attramentaria TaxID=370345 RepID=A0ABD0L674_9CAEN